MNRFLFLIFYIFYFNCVFAQHPEAKRTNHWYFGQNAGLDFSNNTVVADVNGAYDNYEATATISDTAGNLLFYTDAETVWNKNHQIIPNGTSIGGCWSSTQGALIVPQPGNDSIYYIFTTDCAENNLSNGLRYSVVNINLDSGNGAIIQKNVLLHTPVAEKLAGVHHANGVDVWVVTHEWNTSNFLAYRITSLGIDTVPVISTSGSIHNGGTQYGNSNGYLKISPDGSKIVSAKYESGNLELFNFNTSNGIVSNSIILDSGGNGVLIYGVSFSPDNSKLYVSYPFDIQVTMGGRLFQYNLLAEQASNIVASKTLIYFSNTFNKYHFMGMQTGKNNKIYISETNFQTNDAGVVGVINEPNKLGVLCSFQQLGQNLLGKRSRLGLPNFIESYFNCDTCTVDSTTSVSFNQFNTNISVFPNPFEDVLFINSSEAIVSFAIKDISGIIIYERVLDIPQYNIQISNLTLAQGVYTIFVNTKSFNLVQKLIKLTNK